MNKVGYFGGTFDPIHKGHIYVAREVLDKLNLDIIYFMPNSKPPHKRGSHSTFYDRCNMIKLAISDERKIDISYIESDMNTHYTADTLKYIRENFNHEKIYFIIGEDSLRDIYSWYNPMKILEYSSLVVVKREDFRDVDGKSLEEIAKEVMSLYGGEVIAIDSPPINISSTEIRSMLMNNQDISEFVDEKVKEYILKNGLYIKE